MAVGLFCLAFEMLKSAFFVARRSHFYTLQKCIEVEPFSDVAAARHLRHVPTHYFKTKRYCPVYYSPEEPVKPQRCTCLDSTSGFPKDSFYSKEVTLNFLIFRRGHVTPSLGLLSAEVSNRKARVEDMN
uniref:Uncharacterized protein n=1 Tax=Magallana gigas TaxID=29159 RepID=K1Q5R5_MAGGI